jgi:hypothetical protein
MDLVGAEDEVVPGAELGEPREFVAPPDAGKGIVRIAEVKEPRAGRDGPLERVPIDAPAVAGGGALQYPGNGDGHARAVLGRRHERRIDRRQRQHFVTGLGEGLGGDV